MDYVPTYARDEWDKGRKQGIEQGIEQGIATGERVLLMQLLEYKFTEIPAVYLSVIQLADPQQLSLYARRVLDCDDIAAVFKQ